MKFQVYFKRFQQIHLLIQRGSATSPQQLAKSLSLSEPALYRYLKVLKEYGIPIAFANIEHSALSRKYREILQYKLTDSFEESIEYIAAQVGFEILIEEEKLPYTVVIYEEL